MGCHWAGKAHPPANPDPPGTDVARGGAAPGRVERARPGWVRHQIPGGPAGGGAGGQGDAPLHPGALSLRAGLGGRPWKPSHVPPVAAERPGPPSSARGAALQRPRQTVPHTVIRTMGSAAPPLLSSLTVPLAAPSDGDALPDRPSDGDALPDRPSVLAQLEICAFLTTTCPPSREAATPSIKEVEKSPRGPARSQQGATISLLGQKGQGRLPLFGPRAADRPSKAC